MGNFALISKSNKAAQQRVKNYYREVLGKTSIERNAGRYQLIYCDKGFLNESHFFEDENGFVCFSGSPVFRNSATVDSTVSEIYAALRNDEFDPDQVRGSYAFVYMNDGKLYLGHDGIKVANIYCDSNVDVISNSFVVCFLCVEGDITVNKNAASELCAFGHLTGNDTIFHEISKIHHDTERMNLDFHWITKPVKDRDVHSQITGSEEVDRQLKVLDNFFSEVSPFLNHYGANLGTSDGHDSRLLAGFFNKKISHSNFYTFWRKKETREIRISKAVAQASGKPLSMLEGKDIYDMSEGEAKANFEDAFHLFDGQPRLHCYFFEDFNTVSFIKKLSEKNLVSVNGMGGEEYRNNQHLLFNRIERNKFFDREIIDQVIPGMLTNAQRKNSISYLRKKFDNELKLNGLENGSAYYNRKQLHFFFNEFQNNAYRLNRTNGENQFVMQMPPYLDPQVVLHAYQSLPHQGVSYWFQQEMLRRNDPQLAKVGTVSGYTYAQGEPFKDRMKYVLKSMLPAKIVAAGKAKKLSDKSGFKLMEKFPFISGYLDNVKQLHLDINIDRLFLHPERWPVILSLGFALHKFAAFNKTKLNR
jgi:hypothetical protein